MVNAYVDECLKYDSAISSTRWMCIILDYNYKNSDLNTVMSKQCQHINAAERYILLHISRKIKDMYMFDGTLGTWNTTPVDL